MKKAGTLSLYMPDLFNQVQKMTSLSYRGLCDEMRPIMNTPGYFTIDDHDMLAPQLVKFTEKANEYARVIEERFSERMAWQIDEMQQEEYEFDGNPDEDES